MWPLRTVPDPEAVALKACPFCGSRIETEDRWPWAKWQFRFAIEHLCSALKTRIELFDRTREALADRWNHRPLPTGVRQQLDQAKQSLESLEAKLKK